jgi:poly(A) polymerase
MVALHHRPKALAEEGVTDSAIRRLVVDAGDNLEDLFTLCRADMTSANLKKIAFYRQNLIQVQQQVAEVEERDALRNFQPPVTGEDIMRIFGLSPSKEVGILKTEIRESILDGKIKNNREEALQLMYEKAQTLGLNPIEKP